MDHQSRPAGYSGLQKGLHWLVALMVPVLLAVGFAMTNRAAATNFDAVTNQMYTAHKTFGFIVLWLVALRIVIRARRGVPEPEASLRPSQALIAELVHKALYALLVVVPVLGWMGVSAFPATGLLFGLSLPPIMPVNEGLAKALLKLHGYGAIALAGLVAMHVGAGLAHAFILKDGVMRRMLP